MRTSLPLLALSLVFLPCCDGDADRDPKGDRNGQPQIDGRQETVIPESRHKSTGAPND